MGTVQTDSQESRSLSHPRRVDEWVCARVQPAPALRTDRWHHRRLYFTCASHPSPWHDLSDRAPGCERWQSGFSPESEPRT